jgi:endonuclease YncB( thermonuclease family)
VLLYLFRQPDGLFVNQEVVRQGYGYAKTGLSFQYQDTFQAYEQRAREAGKGLWSIMRERIAELSPEATSAPNSR